MESLTQSYVDLEIPKNEVFIVYYLYNDPEQTVKVDEVEEIDFSKVSRHLIAGGSVFISQIPNTKTLWETPLAIEYNTTVNAEIVPVTSEQIIKVLGTTNIERIDDILDKQSFCGEEGR